MTIVKKTEDSLTNMRNKYLKGANHSSTVNMTHAINSMRICSENSNSHAGIDNNDVNVMGNQGGGRSCDGTDT